MTSATFEPRFIVGIDLGTSNSLLAYAEADSPSASGAVHHFAVPQLVDSGVVAKHRLLPSFVLLPGDHELSADALDLPWPGGRENRMAVGRFARQRAAETPNRVIASAKSWLCCEMVDRRSAILPWGDPDDAGRRMSPVSASAAVLKHLRDAWNHVMADGDRSARLENQQIILTVPASFDAVARELTVAAAAEAGFTDITLMEEPLAAFYAWTAANRDEWRRQVAPGDRILVCDIGGGTTDLSLIEVGEKNGELDLQRIAVGEHLLVGGDNMDMALAYSVARQMSQNGLPDKWQMQRLFQVCREAKEKLMRSDAAATYPIAVPGRGAGLIGGTLRAELGTEQAFGVLLDGFFPICEAADRPQADDGLGIHELGLKYEADPAVTRHLAAFLQCRETDGSQRQVVPTAVLFNGGVMKSERIRNRIMAQLAHWRPGDLPSAPIRQLHTADTDLAVAAGAVAFGLARKQGGLRVRSGLNRSYYIGIKASMPAIPGVPAPVKALCVAPFGTEEGSVVDIAERTFILAVGEPARFDLLSATTRPHDVAGQTVEDWHGALERVTVLETVLDGPAGATVPVTLETRVTAVGTLEIWCLAAAGDRRWKLEFTIRRAASATAD